MPPPESPARAATRGKGTRATTILSPKSSPAQPPVEPFRPFPINALPEPIRSFVCVGASALGCDPSYVALPLLAALASAIGNTRRIRLKRGWDEAPIIWSAIVGESGTLKSPALDLALQPLVLRQREAIREQSKAMKGYEAEKARYDRDFSLWKKSRVGGDPPLKPEVPIACRC